jgi:hypothetical protein
MPRQMHPILPDTKDFGAYYTPNISTLKPLFLVLFDLIFKASKA